MAYKRKKKTKGRGDRVWRARNSVGECGVSGIPIEEGMQCLYLKCEGKDIDPANQIVGRPSSDGTKTENTTPDGRMFRSVPTGSHRCGRNACQEVYSYWQRFCSADHPSEAGKKCRAPTKAIFKWQVNKGTEAAPRWHDVIVWERAVIATEAVKRGFHVPTMADGAFAETEAEKGTRTIGASHGATAATPESPLADLGRAALSEEETRLGAPAVEPGDSDAQADLDWLLSL